VVATPRGQDWGRLLEDWTEEWVFEERQVRKQAYLRALETLAAEARARGELAAAEQHLRRAVATDPLRESAQRALMLVQAAAGSYAAAIQTYRERPSTRDPRGSKNAPCLRSETRSVLALPRILVYWGETGFRRMRVSTLSPVKRTGSAISPVPLMAMNQEAEASFAPSTLLLTIRESFPSASIR